MGKILSDDKRNPHRFDPSPRSRCPSNDRGWRIRSDLYHGYYLDKAGVRIEELEVRIKHLQSLLTPRRIDEDTPDGVLVWATGSWIESYREPIGDWRDITTGEHFDPQPKWWLPMLPAPEEKV